MKKNDSQGSGDALEPWVAPEMEVRLVALVLGEASEFERAELEEAMAQEPELKAFYDRIVGAHRMLGDALSGEGDSENDAWKMSSERRSAVLVKIRGEGRTGAKPGEKIVSLGRRWSRHLGSIAAILVAVLAVVEHDTLQDDRYSFSTTWFANRHLALHFSLERRSRREPLSFPDIDDATLRLIGRF
jgi:ferric-dicitrate binding protein FerR (iron transport regulator)